MTKEEFLRYAQNRETPANKSVYELRVFDYDGEITGYKKQKDGSWSFNIRQCFTRLYSDFKKAEIALKEYVNSDRYTDSIIYGAEVWRICLDIPIYEINGDLGWWLYDSTGKLIDHSVCDMYHIDNPDYPFGVYFGRKKDEIRFKEGDIVEITSPNREEVYLGIINDLPPTNDQMWELYQRRVNHWGLQKNKNFSCDYFSDVMADCYYIVGNEDYDPDIPVISLRRPTFTPPKEALVELKKRYDRWIENKNIK